MTILVNPFRAGSGIDINYNTGTIANSGVLSVDSNTGNLTLSAGTGISISGLTITNTGVDSLVAGTGISLSATTGSVTVTNSGVTSFQGDTGSISLSAGTGISISGLTISNAGVTSLQSETGALSLTAGTGISISGLTITNTGITSLTAGNGISVSGSTIAMSGSYSGNFTASGIGTFATINANSADTVGGKGGDEIIALYGGLQSFPSSTTGSMYGFGISSSTLESYASTNFNFWQLTFSTSTPAFSIGGADDTGGTQFLVKTANNILDDGTGNLQIGNFYYKWSNSANNYVYADTANMVFGTNGGFQWKNSSNTIITTLSSDGSMAMTGSLTVDSNLYVTGSIGVILGQNTAAAYSGIGTDGTIRDWLGYQDSGSDNLYLRSPAGDLYLAASGAVATGTTGVPTSVRNTLDDGSGNMSVSGSLTVTDDVTTDSSFVAIGNGFNPNSSVDTANIQSGTNSNPQAFGGGIMLRDNSYFAGLWTDNNGAALELGAGGSSTSISSQLTVNTGSVSIAGSLTVNGTSFNNMDVDTISIQILASNTGGVSFPFTNSYNIVASFQPIQTGSNTSLEISCWAIEHNSGGGANQYLIINSSPLTVGDSYSSVTYALELTGATGQTVDSTTNTLFFGSSKVTNISANATFYVYYGTALTHYTHYLTYATATVSFQ
jgi:hypothetical protein